MNTNEKIKVFLVDDDIMFTETLKHSLKKENTEIQTFPTGEACLKNIKSENPEVVVLDYFLSGNHSNAMNGIQVLNKIKKSNPETEVIMISSQDNVTVAVDTLKYGAYDYIAKGQSAFVKIKNDIKRIYLKKEQINDFDKKTIRQRRINILIVTIVLILYILNRIL